jgi:hypothetical protein
MIEYFYIFGSSNTEIAMKKIKDYLSKTFGGVRDVIKGIAKLAGYTAAAASFVYAVVFAVKTRGNGKPFHVNLIAGFIHGIGKVIGSAISVAGDQD